jgi:hypothetical protein
MPRDISWMVTRAKEIQPNTTEGTLYKRTSGDTFDGGTPYTMYVEPMSKRTGIGADGWVSKSGSAVLYQEGQSSAPDVEDKIVDADGSVYMVLGATITQNTRADWGIHLLSVTHQAF